MNKKYGQLTFFYGSQYLGYVDYVKPTRKRLRYAIDWANRSDKYNSWTTAVYWFNGTKQLTLHSNCYASEINSIILTY